MKLGRSFCEVHLAAPGWVWGYRSCSWNPNPIQVPTFDVCFISFLLRSPLKYCISSFSLYSDCTCTYSQTYTSKTTEEVLSLCVPSFHKIVLLEMWSCFSGGADDLKPPTTLNCTWPFSSNCQFINSYEFPDGSPFSSNFTKSPRLLINSTFLR